MKKLFLISAACAVAWLMPASLLAVPNNWTNSSSALWRSGTNWSLALVPNGASNTDPTQITNAGTKTVTIDSATPAGNLGLRTLTISAPVGSTNTLALVNIPPGTPLTTSKPFLISNRGAVVVTNSAITTSDSFDIVGGSLLLQSGSLTFQVNCDLQSGSVVVNGGTLNATLDPLLGTTGIRMGRFSGANANLTLNGGVVNAARITLGSVSGSQNSLNISGGTLISGDTFSAAQLPATTGNVTLSSGNLVVTNGTTKIADRATATFTQSGGNAHFSDLSLGDLGFGTYNLSGGTFTVTPHTNTALCIVGNLENADFNQSGGVAVIQNEIHIADFAGVFANVNVRGGQFFATNDLIAIGREGVGTMTVSNATVVLTNTSVGRHLGSSGTLNVQVGGNLSLIADLSLGRLAGSSGQANVTGGSLSLTNDEIWIGRGGSGDMTISGGSVSAKRLHVGNSDDGTNAPSGTLAISGGDTILSSGLFIGTAGLSTGNATFTGGNLFVTNNTGSADFVVADGNFALSGGTLTADLLDITNGNGAFTFTSGLMRAKAMNVSNGQPFTVGDGVNPATLELQGGTFTFANGLVISPNATVTGCGTVIGQIINNGTYDNPCGGQTPTAPTISSFNKTANSTTLSCESQNGFTYTLEYKQSLTNSTWTPILPGLAGNGGVLNLIDPSATNASRYYRVKVQ